MFRFVSFWDRHVIQLYLDNFIFTAFYNLLWYTPAALSNKFADIFNDKVEKIRLDIDRDTVDSVNDADIGSVVQANSSDLETHLLEFKELDESESMRLLLIVQTNHATLIAYLPGYLNITLMLF